MKNISNLLTSILFCFILVSCGRGNNDETNRERIDSDLVPFSDAGDQVQISESENIAMSKVGYELAKQLAISLLNLAAEKTKPPESTFYQAMSTALSKVNFDIPSPGKDLKQCVRDQAVLAFVMTNDPSTIHLCARSFKNTPKKKLAQILIHETSHIVGVHNECMATKIEVSVMRLVAKGLAFKNGYMNACGFE